MTDKCTDPKDIEMGNIEEYMHAKYFRKAETPDKRTETHPCDYGRKETHGDVISRQANCVYCHEDSEGYVTPIEKNGHAVVRHSPIYGWILSVKYGAWRKDVPIRFCPMCGRELKT